MLAFAVRRSIMALVVLVLVSIIVFVAMRLLPGDPLYLLLTASEEASYSQAQLEVLRRENGLDKPLVVQYFSWMGGVLHGDLGKSILQRAPVSQK